MTKKLHPKQLMSKPKRWGRLSERIYVCGLCGTKFIPKTTTQKYCCKECKRSAEPSEKNYYKACTVCNATFRPNSANHKYCSEECAQIASYEQQKRDRWVIFNRDRFRCIYCGKASFNNWSTELHVDHIYPLKRGGKSIASNLVTSCQRCNLGKATGVLSNEQEILQEVARRNEEAGVNPNLYICANPNDSDATPSFIQQVYLESENGEWLILKEEQDEESHDL